jgi:uncharacterized protein
MPLQAQTLRRTWTLLFLPPVLFLLVIVVTASVYFGIITQGDAQAIADRTQAATPYILATVQVILLWLIFHTLKKDDLTWREAGWEVQSGQNLWSEILTGAAFGTVLGVLYVTVLSPFQTFLQTTFGDYVPPESLLTSLGSAVLAFFIANVLFAPFVEEALYRGYALPRLVARFGPAIGVVIHCLFFGLLHWAGGFWYILLTGIVPGGLFAGLYLWRRNVITPFAAHLALNLVEFLFVWLVIR